MATDDESPNVTRRSTETLDATERKRAEEALRDSNQLLEKIFSSLEEAIFVVEMNTRTIVACNAAAERIFGYSKKEMIGRNTEFLHVDRATYAEFGRKLFSALEADGVFHTEYQVLRKDGSVFLSEHIVTEIVDDSGQRTSLLSVLRDITERKRAEEALRESEERYRMIINNTNEVIYKVSLEDDPLGGSVEFVSGQVKSILGYAPDEFLQNSELWLQIVHPDDVPALGEITRKTLASREPGTRQYRLRHKETGEYRWMEDKTVPLTDGDGNVVAYQGIARDITERRQAEEALRESEERFRSAFEHAAIGMALVGTDGRILQANQSMCEMLGYSEEELTSTTWQTITHPDDLNIGLDLMRQTLAGEINSCQFEKRYLHKLGHEVWALLSFSLVRDADGSPLYFISQIQDITRRKLAEEQLQVAREELEGRVERQLLRRNPYGLTFRELTALHLVAAGKSDKEIGVDLGISPLTARKHLSNILAKMDAASRTEAVARSLREGLLD